MKKHLRVLFSLYLSLHAIFFLTVASQYLTDERANAQEPESYERVRIAANGIYVPPVNGGSCVGIPGPNGTMLPCTGSKSSASAPSVTSGRTQTAVPTPQAPSSVAEQTVPCRDVSFDENQKGLCAKRVERGCTRKYPNGGKAYAVCVYNGVTGTGVPSPRLYNATLPMPQAAQKKTRVTSSAARQATGQTGSHAAARSSGSQPAAQPTSSEEPASQPVQQQVPSVAPTPVQSPSPTQTRNTRTRPTGGTWDGAYGMHGTLTCTSDDGRSINQPFSEGGNVVNNVLPSVVGGVTIDAGGNAAFTVQVVQGVSVTYSLHFTRSGNSLNVSGGISGGGSVTNADGSVTNWTCSSPISGGAAAATEEPEGTPMQATPQAPAPSAPSTPSTPRECVQPAYDCSKCNGLQSYPTYQKEACLTQCGNDYQRAQDAFNQCMGY